MRTLSLTIAAWLIGATPALASWTQLSGPRPPAAAAFGTHGDLLFLGTNEADAGDVFVSSDGGHSWANAGKPNGGVIEFLSTPSAIFAGTYLSGLLRSDDDGATWTRVQPLLFSLSSVSALLALDTQTLLAGVTPFSPGPLHRSTDQGLTWAAIPGSPMLACHDLTVSGAAVLAAGKDVGVLRSTDAGLTWATANVGLPVTRHVDRFAHVGASVFAAVRPQFSAVVVFRSDDDGATWQPTSTNLPSAAAVNAFFADGGDLYLGTWVIAGASGLFRSTDGGIAWQEITTALPVPDRILSGTVLEGDVVVGTADGAFRTTDGGASWIDTWRGSAGIFGSEAALDVDGALVVGAHHTTNVGTGVWRTTDFGASWAQALGIGMNTTAVDLVEHDGTVFAALYGLERGVSRSTDGGLSFAPSDAGVASNTVMKCLHAHGNVLLAGSWEALYRSTNDGLSWTSFPAMRNVQRFVSVGTELYAGRYGNGAAISTDAGLTWTPINAGLPSGASTFLNDVVSLDGVVYAAINDGGGIRRWNGTSWVSAGLDGTIVNELLAVDGVLVAGSALEGVWTSPGSGAWAPLDDGYFGGEVYALATTSDRIVLGSRGHGLWSLPRSELPTATSVIGNAPPGTGDSKIVIAPNPFRPATDLRYSVSRTGLVRLAIHDVAGRQVRDLVQAHTTAGDHVVRWDGRDARGVSVPAGVYFVRLEQAGGSTTEKVVRTR